MTPAPSRNGPVLLAPLVIFLVAMLGFPLLVDLAYSVSSVDFQTLRQPRFSGADNFRTILADPAFWAASWFSLRFALVTSLVQAAIGLSLAVFLAPIISRRPWLMAILMMPLMVAPALVGLMYRLILHEFVGVVPYYLVLWTGDSPPFLDAAHAFRTLVVVEVLQWTPFSILILYTAYRAIPDSVREAARMDGAGALALFRRIELPMLLPTLAMTFFIRFIDAFRVFDNVYVLTGSGAGGSTTSLSIYIYKAFFKSGSIGTAVAASLLLLAASTMVYLALSRIASLRTA